MRRLPFFAPLTLVFLWMVVPWALILGYRLPTGLIIIHARSPAAFLWLFFALTISLWACVRIGWRGAAIPSKKGRALRGRFGIPLLLFTLWVLTPDIFLGSDTVRQPPIEIRVVADGAALWLFLALIGTVVILILVGRRRRQTRNAHYRQQQLLGLLSDQLNEGVALYDWRLNLQYANATAERTLLKSDQFQTEITRLLRRAAETQGVASQSLVIDETQRVNVQAAPLADGSISLISRPMQNDADQSNFYERYIRRIVHDMRNPLAAIIAHAGNLRAAPDMDATAYEYTATTIENEAQRLTRLVDSILFDARLSYVPPMKEPIDLGDIIDNVFFQYDERAIREDKTIEVEKPSTPAPLEADHDLLVRALGNLVDNSLKYSQSGAIIRLMLEPTATHYLIKVADTGEGIPPDYLPDRIFEALVRVRPKEGSLRAKDTLGSGLGLSIVKKIAELHGGEISVESTVGKGTTMMLVLPRNS